MSFFGTYIKVLMDQRGWSQEDLAGKVGVAPSTVSNWVNNDDPVTPKKATLNKLASVFGVTRREMFEHAGFEIEDSVTPDARTQRLAALIREMPRVEEITEELFSLPPDDQDIALTALEAHLRERRRRRAQSIQR